SIRCSPVSRRTTRWSFRSSRWGSKIWTNHLNERRLVRQLLLDAARAVAAVANQAFFLEIGNRSQFDAPGAVQAKINAAGLSRLDHVPLGQRELIDFEHPDFAQFFLHSLTQG